MNSFNNYNNFNNYNLRYNMMPKTNKIYVTSLEDALSRPCDYNTEIVYFHQDQPLMIEVITDGRGIKSYNLYDFTPKRQDKQKEDFVPRSEYESLVKDFTVLKTFVKDKFKEVNENEPNVQRSDNPVKSEQPL